MVRVSLIHSAGVSRNLQIEATRPQPTVISLRGTLVLRSELDPTTDHNEPRQVCERLVPTLARWTKLSRTADQD
jgi:hypothetical protein